MRAVPILHFSGHFRFQMPELNNDPRSTKIPFDPTKTKEEVIGICGCDPAKYYEFEFFDVHASQVTYSDGTSATNGDPVLGRAIALNGFLPDVSPSAICARLFAGRFRIGSVITGELNLGVQSDLRLSIRQMGFADETAAAHYILRMRISSLNGIEGSRYFAELGSPSELEVYFHVNHYTRVDNATATPDSRLTGDVYGYIRPAVAEPSDTARVVSRRLVAHPDLAQNQEVKRLSLTSMTRKDAACFALWTLMGSTMF